MYRSNIPATHPPGSGVSQEDEERHGSHRRGGNRVLGKPNAIIDRDAVLKQPPDIVVKYITDGLESRPGEPTTRCADLRYSEFRCAFFRNAIGSESGQLGQRDMILAAIWSVKNYVTEADVRKSWKDTRLFPFVPDGHRQW